MEERLCKGGDHTFLPYPHIPNQEYCSTRSCQLARKREWQKKKLAADPDYKANQTAAAKAWRAANPDYWRKYRARRSKYTERNRQLQTLRNHRRRNPYGGLNKSLIANMDAYGRPNSPVPTGCYRLIPEGVEAIANMDAYLLVKLDVISNRYAQSPPSGP